jgi:hypothetical protein
MAYGAISDFKSALKLGGARPSLFEIKITASPSQVTIPIDHFTKCFTSEIPGLTITPIEKQYFGRTIKFPGEMSFDTLSTTFYNSEEYDIRRALEDWTNVINDPASNKGVSGNPQTYSGEIELIHYGKDGTKGMTFTFKDCWPSEVGQIDLSYDTGGEMESFVVTWTYDYFETTAGSITGQSTNGTQV